MAPPGNVLGGLACLRAVLVRTGSLAVVVDHFVCYPTGFELSLLSRFRTPEAGGRPGGAPPPAPLFGAAPSLRPPSPEPGYGGLRFGLAFADGRTTTDHAGRPPWEAMAGTVASVTEHRDPPGSPPEPEPPRLAVRSGHGGHDHWVQDYWVWGLPPGGPLGLVVEWPAAGVPETRVDVDGSTLRRAADHAEVLWEE